MVYCIFLLNENQLQKDTISKNIPSALKMNNYWFTIKMVICPIMYYYLLLTIPKVIALPKVVALNIL